jgi:hypothetical protein
MLKVGKLYRTDRQFCCTTNKPYLPFESSIVIQNKIFLVTEIQKIIHITKTWYYYTIFINNQIGYFEMSAEDIPRWKKHITEIC